MTAKDIAALENLFPVSENSIVELDANLANSLVKVGAATEVSMNSYLKFDRGGSGWIYGKDADVIEADDVLAVDPTSFTIGWMGWNQGTPLNGPKVPIGQIASLPAESTLEVIPAGAMNGWKKEVSVVMKFVEEGGADATQVSYGTSSVGGKSALLKLAKEVGLGMLAHPDFPICLVSLGVDSYMHKEFGKTFVPKMDVVGWADAKGTENPKLKPKLKAA